MISNKRLRRIALSRQGLNKVRPFGKGRSAVLRAVEHCGYIQIDTLSVVQRAHHHTLWTRVPDYTSGALDELVNERKVFEYWSHAASYLPMKDYRFSLPRMLDARRGKSVYGQADPAIMRKVKTRIRREGPLKARDFVTASKRGGSWWNWKPAKHALEQLFMQGHLMVIAREGMQKVYDLAERVLPKDVNTTVPSDEEFADYLVTTALRANGFTTFQNLAHLRTGEKLRAALAAVLSDKISRGVVAELDVEGFPIVYADCEALNERLSKPASKVRLLSPFDNAVIHRDRLQFLFDYDYRLECYVPAHKRKYGYFCLPVLYDEKLVGRVDCKAHRQTGQFEVIHLHLSDSRMDLDSFADSFAKEVQQFAAFNECHCVTLTNVSPRKITRVFRQALRPSG